MDCISNFYQAAIDFVFFLPIVDDWDDGVWNYYIPHEKCCNEIHFDAENGKVDGPYNCINITCVGDTCI